MNITLTQDHNQEFHSHKRVLVFRDAEPVLLDRNYSHGGKRFLPERAVASWDHGEPIKDIRVYGPVLKKDGTPGLQEGSVDYITPAHSMWGRHTDYYTKAPAWLLELFGIEVPEGAA